MKRYPVTLDIHGQHCLVIGGGVVAKRKVEALIPCGPKIVVLSPVLCDGLAELAEKQQIEWQQRKYRSGDLQGAKLVFAATGDSIVQQQIKKEADSAGILVNVINDPRACSFQVPATFRRGDLLLTISTCGASPALAARIRKELEQLYGKEYEVLLNLMAAVRKQIVTLNDDQSSHKLLFEKLLDSNILPALQAGDWKKLQVTLEEILPPEVEVVPLVNTLQTQENASMETTPC